MLPKLIIVSGAPATGKTVMARYLAHALNLPLLSKDTIKEQLFDEGGQVDAERSTALGEMSFNRLFEIIESKLRANQSLVVEANFKRTLGHHTRFQALRHQLEFWAIQIHCQATVETIVHRFQERVKQGQRHPGHADQRNVKALIQNLQDNIYEIDIGDQRLTIDTTDFANIDYEAIANTCRI